MIIVMIAVSVFAFIIIQLPPGDYITSYVSRLEQQWGGTMDPAAIENLKRQYGLDKPMYEQYFLWIKNMFNGDLGRSFEWNQPVSKLLSDALPITILLSVLTLIFTYGIAVPMGIYSATHQYSFLDYLFSIIAFIGVGIPNFFLALILMYVFNEYFGISAGGLYSVEFINEPMSFAKFINMLGHLPLPILVIGLNGLASVMRVMRGTLLDEIKKPYVIAARARGLDERRLLYKYPVRIAMNPIISTIGSILPGIVSGATITAIVLDINTVGSLLYSALLSQDMFLAGSSIMILTFLTVIGIFISDILLALVDPRIRMFK
jgi:peptide/nickel transport system permease protein